MGEIIKDSDPVALFKCTARITCGQGHFLASVFFYASFQIVTLTHST